MKKHADATTKVPISTLLAGNVEEAVVMLLYSIEPSIIEHMRMAKIRPKGRSTRELVQCWASWPVYHTIFGACKLV